MKTLVRTVLAASLLTCAAFAGVASAKDYNIDFRNANYDRDTLVPFGFHSLYGLQLLKPEPLGLRIIVPHHQGEKKPYVGFLPTLKLHGSFELAVSYEMLSVSTPRAGGGAGADLYILAEDSLHSALIRRCVTPQGKNAFFVHLVTRDERGKRRSHDHYFPAKAKNGVLVLRRIGTTLEFQVTENDENKCRKLHEVEFGSDTIGMIRVATTTDGSPTTTETRWGHLTIRSDQLERVNVPIYGNRQVDAPTIVDTSPSVRDASTSGDLSGRPLFLMDADGSNLRQLPRVENYALCGSPDWSRDGKQIAFDAWRAVNNESFDAAQIFVVNRDGGDAKHLGSGAMPSFSPDGKQIAFSCYNPRGVWTMNADGSDRKRIDADGWSARFSPVSNEIAYAMYDEEGRANIKVLDVETGKQHLLLADEHRRYSSIQINFDWSPDGKRIALLGQTADSGHELVIVAASGSDDGFKVRLRENTRLDLTWSPDGKSLLYPFPDRSTRRLQIHQLKVDSDDPPQPLPGQPRQRNNTSSVWSPDGKTIVFASGPGR